MLAGSQCKRSAEVTLSTCSLAKPWGRDRLPAPFVASEGERIGEIWFERPQQVHQLLVKYIFTSENLSVQVHPSDSQTQAMGLGCQGKDECWVVVDADPGAVLGIGFAEPCSAEDMRAAALDGSIMDRIVWHPVKAGDFFYIPANTVHAIGAGVSLIEVQQNSDITYRLYDYGRPRSLHVEEAVAVADGSPYPAHRHRAVPERGEVTLVEGPFFRLDRIDGSPSAALAAHYGDKPLLVIPLGPGVAVAGQALANGSCGLCPSITALEMAEDALALVTQPL